MKKFFNQVKFKDYIKYIFIFFLVLVILILVEFYYNKHKNSLELSDDKILYNSLVINEIMTSNDGSYTSDNGECFDWIELYNGTDRDIDLNGYRLSDEDSGETKWLFPNVTIKSKEYMVVYLTGGTREGLYANLALNKSGGETVSIKSKNGKVVDSVKTQSLDKNMVMARNYKGEWIVTSDITPGFSNNKNGRDEYLKDLTQKSDELVISEVLPNNKGNYMEDGTLYSYIELENNSDKTINLHDYFLSDKDEAPFLWRLPNYELKAGEVYLVYASKLDTDNHTNFSLNNKNGKVILSHKNKIVNEIEYHDLDNGYAYILNDNKYVNSSYISPGYKNNSDGIDEFNKQMRKNPQELIINEVMNSNDHYLKHHGEYYDWIELYNNTDKSINLSDYTLTTDDNDKQMYSLPDIELKSHDYFIVMASGNKGLSDDKYNHTNFKLSSKESLYLYKKSKLIDAYFIAEIPKGYSYGRRKDSGIYYYSIPTPAKKNIEDGYFEVSYAPSFSIKPGIYNEDKVTVELNGEGTIYYTLDGGIPNKNSKVYKEPLFLDKTTVIRAITIEPNKVSSAVTTGSYIINEKHTLSVLSISLPDSSFKKLNSDLDDTTLTVGAHAELYEKDSSFSIDCGMKLFGGQTRFIPKKSFALKFTSLYGPSKLEYKVFDNRDAIKYDTLVIRSGSQDSVGAMFRDELATSIMDDYGTVDVQAYKPIILYINGKYWGIYFIREKVDDKFISNHYDIDDKNTNIIRIDNDVSEGSIKDYKSLINYVKNHDISKDDNYKYVTDRLDIDNYIDFWIGELYTTNNDIVNMRFFNNPSIDNGKFKMIFYDFDYAFYNYSKNYIKMMVNKDGLGEHKYDNSLLRGLMQNEKFRLRFIERLSYNLKNVWTDDNLNKRYDELYNLLKPEMKRNQERWNSTYEVWEEECKVLKDYLKKRKNYLLKNVQDYFKLSDKEMKKYFE